MTSLHTRRKRKSTKILLHAFGKFISSIFNFNILFFKKACVLLDAFNTLSVHTNNSGWKRNTYIKLNMDA